MVFRKFVQIGRAVYINYGPMAGRVAVIVEMINTNRVLVEGPNVRRQELSLRRVSLTDFVLDVQRGVNSSNLRNAIEEFGLMKKWDATPYGKTLQRAAVRSKLTDFERFKVMVLRKRVNKIIIYFLTNNFFNFNLY